MARIGVGVGAALIVALVAPSALACGGLVSADGSSEITAFRALMSWADDREEILAVVGFEGTPQDFAWLMPFPAPPDVEGGDDSGLAAGLEISAAPLRSDHVPSVLPFVCACGGADDDEAGGAVVLRETIVGDLEFVTLGASRADDLLDWLDENDFELHDRQLPTIQSYLDKGWVFVAAKAASQETEAGRLTAVKFSFPTAEPVYPLAMAGADHESTLPMSLLVVTPFRPVSSTYAEEVVRPDDDGVYSDARSRAELRYSAPLSAGEADRVDASVAAVEGAWLTRYEATWETSMLRNDLEFAQSAEQSPVVFGDLLDGYAADKRWVRVGQGVFAYLLLLPLVLAIAGGVVVAAGLFGGGFRRKAEATPAKAG